MWSVEGKSCIPNGLWYGRLSLVCSMIENGVNLEVDDGWGAKRRSWREFGRSEILPPSTWMRIVNIYHLAKLVLLPKEKRLLVNTLVLMCQRTNAVSIQPLCKSRYSLVFTSYAKKAVQFQVLLVSKLLWIDSRARTEPFSPINPPIPPRAKTVLPPLTSSLRLFQFQVLSLQIPKPSFNYFHQIQNTKVPKP